MKIIAIDDEYHALSILKRAIEEAVPDSEVVAFQKPELALAYLQQNKADVVFVDIQMRGIHGLALAEKINDIHGQTNIVFVTGFEEYAKNAFDLRASGYLMKPVSAEDIQTEMAHLRYPISESQTTVTIRTFGNFDVLIDGEPVLFSRSKAKELLAYLVDRSGAGASARELAAVLWEGGEYTRSRQQQLQTYVSTLKKDLEQAGIADIFIRKRNYYAIDKEKVSCDLYDYQKGVADSVHAYHGEYMTNYSWGEFTAAILDNL